ncbi:T9SS type A sorting domain-containing protein [Mucilaginibacter sp. HC2]|uniref:CBM35 domain-containing protein n=1 Tax=Mucilaginibacter inviolabilis TaxID=2714892 RepID=UPI001407EA1D|nr:CBM35 domain-containing protein [Mucilaginibacter inviolabilis]NHA06729.1 T9SS type A sorting domain-containing protein [Mucilaginibacter inviolabilis]
MKQVCFIPSALPQNRQKLLTTLFSILLLLITQVTFAQITWTEAESGTISNGAAVQTNSSSSGGQQVGNLGGPSNGTLSIPVNVATAGQYTLSVNYLTADPRNLYITVNNDSAVIVACNSGSWSTVATTTLVINLQAGANTIKLNNNALQWAPNVDRIGIAPIFYEAEAGTLAGGANIQSCPSCSGASMVGNLGTGSVTNTVNVSTAGNYILTVYYATQDPRSFFVSVNNAAATELSCVPSGGWTTVATATLTVALNAGNNTITLNNPGWYAPNADRLSLATIPATTKNISFAPNSRIEYDLTSGKYNVYFNGTKVITDAYATAQSNNLYSSLNYSTRTYSSTPVSDGLGSGTKHIISLSGNGLIPMQQVFYVYNNRSYFYTEVLLNGTGANSYGMTPLVSNNVVLPVSGDNRVLNVPFDNDTFISYNAASLSSSVNTTSSEVSALYDNNSRNGLILGSIEHKDWKSGVQMVGSAGNTLSQLSLFGGFTNVNITRDVRGHGWVGVGATTCKSPKMMVGFFSDWRDGMEEYGKSNRIAEPPYIFNWTSSTPFGWNSWGAIQSNLNLTNAKGVVDFFANNLTGFRNGNTAYIDLDSYWDNLNDSELKQFADYAKSKGLTPGVYWAPFVDWGKSSRTVEGSTYNYTDIWAKENGAYHDLDGCRALDPTHPGTKQRIAYMIGRFKTAGFQMIKIDFLGHAAIEADSYYDGNIHTGMQAYRQGMEYLTDQLAGQMLVYAAISPNLATARYAHMRRIACDAYSSVNDAKYTLNSTNYGWWQTYMYNYIDADHEVLATETLGTNHIRVTSGVITGTVITGDNYSTTGQWTGRAQTLFQNQDVLDIARNGVAFRPVDGNTGTGTSELFARSIGNYLYLAAFNYGTSSKSYTVNFSRIGLPNGTYAMKELYAGTTSNISNNSINFTLGAADASIYRITVGAGTVADVKNNQVIPAKVPSTSKLTYYPNPATSVLHLDNSIEISDLQLTEFGTGHTVKKFSNINNTHYELDLNGLSPGYYVINVTDNKGTTKGYKIYKY